MSDELVTRIEQNENIKVEPNKEENLKASSTEQNIKSLTIKRQRAVAKQQINAWEQLIPWFLTIACTISLICIAWFLTDNIGWFKENAFDTTDLNNDYRLYVYHLHLSMIKRSVGLFSGFAMMFVGAAVCFYIVKSKTNVGVTSTNISFNLVTASPGIIAMVLGGSLIIFSIWSKDSFDPLPLGQKGKIEDKPKIESNSSNTNTSVSESKNSQPGNTYTGNSNTKN